MVHPTALSVADSTIPGKFMTTFELKETRFSGDRSIVSDDGDHQIDSIILSKINAEF